MNDLAHRDTADTISGAAVNLILKTADSAGIDLPSLLSDAGLPALARRGRSIALVSTPSPAQFATTFHALIGALCLHAPQRGSYDAPTKDDVDLFCSCLINCENLGAVLSKAVRFTKISNDRWGELGLLVEHEQVVFYMDSRRHSDSATPMVLDVFALCFFYKLFSWMIAEPLSLIRVEVAHKQRMDGSTAKDIFDCPVIFDSARTALVFKYALLNKPVMRTYHEMTEVLASLPVALMPLPRSTSVSAHVEMIFRRAMSARMSIPNLEQVAHLLGQSVSTLRRHLIRENTSFQALMDRWRMQRSTELLSRTELTIDDIAALLGFSAPSVFSRAFKNWTGYPPSAYRHIIDREPERAPHD